MKTLNLFVLVLVSFVLFGSVPADAQPACFGTLEMADSRAEWQGPGPSRPEDLDAPNSWYVITTWEIQITDITDPDDELRVSWDYEIEVSGTRTSDVWGRKEEYNERERGSAWFRFRAGASSGSLREQTSDHVRILPLGADTMTVDDVTFRNVRCR